MKKIILVFLVIGLMLGIYTVLFCQDEEIKDATTKVSPKYEESSQGLAQDSIENSPEAPSLKVTVRSDKKVYVLGEPVVITYTIQNISSESIIFFDRNYIAAYLDNGQLFPIFAKELQTRKNWKEQQKEYVSMKPKEKLIHTYQYFLVPKFDAKINLLPWNINIQYNVTRNAQDNFYYEFNQEAKVEEKVLINAWTGVLSSNVVKIKIVKQN